MKRAALFLALVLVLAVFSAVAQDKLMRISADELESRMENPHLAFHSKEIARLLGSSRTNVTTRIGRIKEKLKQLNEI